MVDPNDVKSLALCVWREARNQGEIGMTAVMNVILNRVGHPGFAATVHDVIYGKNQFSSMSISSDYQFKLYPTLTDPEYLFCLRLAQQLLSGRDYSSDPSMGAHYYANLITMTSGWFLVNIVESSAHPHTIKIGQHDFYV